MSHTKVTAQRAAETQRYAAKALWCSKYRSKGLPGLMLLGLVVLVIVTGFSTKADAEATGTVIGRVSDALSGEALPGAWVSVEGTGLKVRSNGAGRYVLRGVPGGEQQLRVSYLGYAELLDEVNVDAGGRVVLDLRLRDKFGEVDRIFGLACKRGEVRSLTRQRKAISVSSVLTLGQMSRFGAYDDYTARDVLARMPGVQMGRRGEINIRGIGQIAAGSYYVLLDGQRMATTGFGDRSTDLSMIPLDQIEQIEVIKTLTPDMYADAISGVVNVQTNRPVANQRTIRAIFGSVARVPGNDFVGLGPAASVSYSDPLEGTSFTFNVDVNYQKNYRHLDNLEIGYGIFEFENGVPSDVLAHISPGIMLSEREIFGGRMHIDFEPLDNHRFYVNGMINHKIIGQSQHRTRKIAGSNWINQDTTTGGSFNYAVGSDDFVKQNFSVQSGAHHAFDRLNLEYDTGWSRTSNSYNHFDFLFQANNISFAADMDNRNRPAMTSVDGSIRFSDLRIQPMFDIDQEFVLNQYSANVDLEIPIHIGSFKIGSSVLRANKEMEYRQRQNRILGLITADDYEADRTDPYYVFNRDGYEISQLLDIDALKSFYRSNLPKFSGDRDFMREHSDIRNYIAAENIYSGYGMAKLKFGNMEILGGARLEYSDLEYEGKDVLFSHLGIYSSTEDTVSTHSYLHIFPNAHVKYNLSERTSFRLVYTRSINRPDYDLLAPFTFEHRQRRELFRGNSELEPMTSDNVDFSFDHYFRSIGHLGVGVFHKSLSNFIFERTREFEDEDENIWTDRTFENSDSKAAIFGVEFSWQQRLSFLPGFLNNLGAYASYTWSQSDFDTDYRDDDVRIPGHSPHIVNAALTYTQSRLSGQVSYHWTHEALITVRNTSVIAPSVSMNEEVYLDQYADGAHDLSFSMMFRLSERFRIWADASNLLRDERFVYDHNRRNYPGSIDKRDSVQLRAGIRFDY